MADTGFLLRTKIEHHLQELGLSMSLFIVFVIAPICLTIDGYFFSRPTAIDLATLQGVNTALASIMIAILLTTFSVVFVVMQLASSQFSPRILRYFMYSNVRIQQFFGMYLGAIVWAFVPAILRSFFPDWQLPCTTLASLTLSLYGILISFPNLLKHLADNINVASITNNIKNEVLQEIDALYADTWKAGQPMLYKRPFRKTQLTNIHIVWQGQSGYLSDVDYKRINAAFNTFLQTFPELPTSYLYQKPIVGEFITPTISGLLIVEFTQPLTDTQRQAVIDFFSPLLPSIFHINKYRSYTQDVNFGVRKLVDIAIKAISPAVNDPTTCLNCIDYLGEIVGKLAVKQFPSVEAQHLTHHSIFINEFGFEEFIDFCFDQITQWGKKDPVVVKRIIHTIGSIIPVVQNPFHLKVLIKEVEDMELGNIYVLASHTKEAADNVYTTEQIKAVQREVQRFRRKALQQIKALNAANLLDASTLPLGTNAIVAQAETDSIYFLKGYVIGQEGYQGG